jgi:hypothetical protein
VPGPQLHPQGVPGRLQHRVPGQGRDRAKILDAEILVMSSPTWLGQPPSVAKRVLERMDAMLSETDDLRLPVRFCAKGNAHERHRHHRHRTLDPPPDRHLGRRRRARGRRLGRPGPGPGRVGQRGMADRGRPLLVRDRLPLLRPLHRHPGAGGRRQPGHPGRAARQRRRLPADRPPGAVRAPLRGHRRGRPAGRARAGRPDGLPAGHDLDHLRGDLRRGRPGHGDPVLLDAARRQEPGADGPRRDRPPGRGGRPGGGVRHHDHPCWPCSPWWWSTPWPTPPGAPSRWP